MEAKITLDDKGARIASADVTEKLKKKNLSPSLVTSLNEGCSASWLANSFVIPDVIPQDKDNPAIRGSLFHKIMEILFALPREERTVEKVREITKSTLHSEEFISLASSKEAVEWLKNAINSYYNMGGRPKKVEIASIKDDFGRDKKGLEVFVKGRIGDTEREILGFIDQVTVSKKDSEQVVVQDWKTGAKAKIWKSHTKSTEGLAEQRQQIIYSMLLEQRGVKVESARLVYPVAQEVVNVDLDDEDLKKRVIENVEFADKKLSHMERENTFEYTPNVFCPWCPLSNGICPQAMVKPYKKMQEALAQQPELDDFKGSIEII